MGISQNLIVAITLCNHNKVKTIGGSLNQSVFYFYHRWELLLCCWWWCWCVPRSITTNVIHTQHVINFLLSYSKVVVREALAFFFARGFRLHMTSGFSCCYYLLRWLMRRRYSVESRLDLRKEVTEEWHPGYALSFLALHQHHYHHLPPSRSSSSTVAFSKYIVTVAGSSREWKGTGLDTNKERLMSTHPAFTRLTDLRYTPTRPTFIHQMPASLLFPPLSTLFICVYLHLFLHLHDICLILLFLGLVSSQ